MNSKEFSKASPGDLMPTPEGAVAFLPHGLPPSLKITANLTRLIHEASLALGELKGAARLLPNPNLLIGPLSYREALLTSKIEGTVATAEALFLAEANPEHESISDDVEEVRNYVKAMESGLRELETLPLSNRLIRNIHARLMQGVRGANKRPGEFRNIQNHIGVSGTSIHDARYVPPPPKYVANLMHDFESYLHTDSEYDPIIRLALTHYQFEAIHPFLDGNGRIGRLLITLLLCSWKVLDRPLLYMSTYFVRTEQEYRDLLLEVSVNGNWSGWLDYFVRGITMSAQDAVSRANDLIILKEQYAEAIRSRGKSMQALRLIEELMEHPWTTAAKTVHDLEVSPATANKLIDHLVEIGFLTEVSGRQRGRIFVAQGIQEIIERDVRFAQ